MTQSHEPLPTLDGAMSAVEAAARGIEPVVARARSPREIARDLIRRYPVVTAFLARDD